jgi:3-oxoacyl-[acyl-carrier protein] reductase
MIHFDPRDIILITGASSGIGKASVLRINELGGKVIAVSRSREALEKMRNCAQHPENISLESTDLTKNQDDLPTWVMELASRHGKLKGLVLAAGEQQILPLRALTIKKAKELFDLNYFANLGLCKGFCDKRANAGPGSAIVIISSIASLLGTPGIGNYSASKGAINSLVKSLAAEMARDRIRINAVLPGFVQTELVKKWEDIYTEQYIADLDKKYPLGIGQPEYISDLVAFLLSPSSQWMTGTSIVIDGGATL